ncbi:MAG: ATP-dependent RNA helicase HelY [Myxococcota bacterium]
MTDDVRTSFLALLGFTPDAFQVDAMDALDRGRSVLVAAPTGAGKTVVGEYACHTAIKTGGRCFYTTPIKALSNQKLRDLQLRYGDANVGLLTGDRTINGDAPIVVMTTEVLRNMIYEGRDLSALQAVVLDEVHYLADRSRGAVWEEIIVQLPPHVAVASLSATVSNAEEFGAWLDDVRGGCEIIVSEHRPVPLRHHYFVNDRVYPTFETSKGGIVDEERKEAAAQARGGVPNPEVIGLERRSKSTTHVSKKGRHVKGNRLRWPDRPDVAAELRDRGWLPAIVFVFSRAGCDKAVDEMVRAGARLTTPDEEQEIKLICDTLMADIPASDLTVLRYERFLHALRDGIAAHHAGMVPAFKEAVEVCFQRGLLKLVYATETLALGINMPARTVIIERLEKWNGEGHVMLTPGQYTQLTGRAGRRGLDTTGTAIVLHQRDIPFRQVAGLVGTRSFPLESSFTPSYNMAVNLLRRHTLPEARDLIEQSFAQWQANGSVSSLHGTLAEAETGLDGYAGQLRCHLGDWSEYWQLRHDLTSLEKQESKERRRRLATDVDDGLRSLRPGDVVEVYGVGKHGLAAVVGSSETRAGATVVEVITDARTLMRLGSRELDQAPQVIERVRLPARGSPRTADYRKQVGILLRAIRQPAPLDDPDGVPIVATGPSDEVATLRDSLRGHPCHSCDDRKEHERWQRRADTLYGDATKLRGQIQHRTGDLVRTLDKVLEVLTALGYVDESPSPTDEGLVLAGLYSEVDILVAEAVRDGVFDGLTGPELAAAAAVLVYQPRGDDQPDKVTLPTRALDAVVDDLDDIVDRIHSHERAAGLPTTRDLDLGFAGPAYRWASGRSLEDSLGDLQLTGGDFVRTIKHLADLVGQLRHVGNESVATAADDALHGLRRGIVEA